MKVSTHVTSVINIATRPFIFMTLLSIGPVSPRVAQALLTFAGVIALEMPPATA
jgi:hypothetical protein